MNTKGKVPIGATWIAVSEELKRKSYIWLAERHKTWERWEWKTVRTYDNESEIHHDWCTSYRMAVQEALIWNPSGKKIRYKRIK